MLKGQHGTQAKHLCKLKVIQCHRNSSILHFLTSKDIDPNLHVLQPPSTGLRLLTTTGLRNPHSSLFPHHSSVTSFKKPSFWSFRLNFKNHFPISYYIHLLDPKMLFHDLQSSQYLIIFTPFYPSLTWEVTDFNK